MATKNKVSAVNAVSSVEIPDAEVTFEVSIPDSEVSVGKKRGLVGSAIDTAFRRAPAGAREFIRGAVRGDAADNYMRGFNDADSSELFQHQFLRQTNEGLDTLGVGKLPPLPQEVVRNIAGIVPSAAGVAADFATNPGQLALAAATEGALKSIALTPVGRFVSNKALEELPGDIARSVRGEPNVINTALKTPKQFDTMIKTSREAEARKASDIRRIGQRAQDLKSVNSDTYGRLLDAVDSTATRQQLVEAAGRIHDIGSQDLNIAATKGHGELGKIIEEIAPNHTEFQSAQAKSSVMKTFKEKLSRGEYVDPEEMAQYELSPSEAKALKYPKMPEDVIDARTIQALRRRLRGVSGTTGISRFASSNFDKGVGEIVASDANGLIPLNREYGPVLEAQNKAIRLFKPGVESEAAGSASMAELANKMRTGKNMFPEDRAFVENLSRDTENFRGVGKDFESSLDDLVKMQTKTHKLESLKTLQKNLRLGAAGIISGLGLYKARNLLNIIGLGD